MLWGTACLVVGLLAGFYWISDELHFEGKWRLYLLLNICFCAVVVWRLWKWFDHKWSALLLTGWLVAHLAVYAYLTQVNFNMFVTVVLFPVEVLVLLAVGQVVRARRREAQLIRANRQNQH